MEHYPNETNPVTQAMKDANATIERSVYWTEPGLEITRLRLLTDSDFPMWDVSYCTGIVTHPDGRRENVDVSLPFYQLPKRGIKRAIVEYARADKVFAKGLNILSEAVISRLW